MNKTLSLLGLARRAAKLSIGLSETVSSAKSGKARLILYASDISPKTAKEARFAADKSGIPYAELECTMEEMSFAIGIKAGVVAVNDKGFAQKLTSLCNTIRKDESAI